MNRILFVDDEPQTLDGIQNLLHRYRKQWHMEFVTSGEAALERLRAEPFDVIVTDGRMPKMDGAELLRRVQEEHPRTLRIVLSGQAEHEMARRVVHTAHQCLAKPCDAPVLKEVIERSCNLHSLLLDERLRRTIEQMGPLPAVPGVVAELKRILDEPDSTLEDVAALVERDPELCDNVLQLVNSGFFGLAHRFTEIGKAVSYLGIDALGSLVIAIEVFEFAKGHPRIPGFNVEDEHAHALRTARIAGQIGSGRGVSRAAFIAGVLHDVGRLILAALAPDRLAVALQEARRSGRPASSVEEEVLGVTHAEIGAYLLGLWGQPLPVVEAVAFHHRPRRVAHRSVDLLGIVHIADGLAHELDQDVQFQGIAREPIDREYLAAMGIQAEVQGLRGAAAS